MPSDPRKPIFDAVKAARGRGFANPDVAILDEALDKLNVPRVGQSPASLGDPDWLAEARKLVGTKEIVGPNDNPWIVKKWAQLGAPWFNDDETPWCGLFVASCMQAVGLSYPGKGMFARALSWKDWGKPCGLLLGAVAVFQRGGGGHVAFLVGEDAAHVYVLGGNQSNSVSIMAIAKDRLVATRWPSERALGEAKAPRMSNGVVSTNEA